MLVTEALLGLLSAFPLHYWLLRVAIRLVLSFNFPFWITVTAGGACLFYQGFTRLRDDVNEDGTEDAEERDSGVEEAEEEEEEEGDDSGTDEDSSAWMTVNDSEEN